MNEHLMSANTDTEILTRVDPRERMEEFLGAKLPVDFTGAEAVNARLLNRENIGSLILERPPFMWIDCAAITDGGNVIWGAATMTEEMSDGHFPGRPIVPLIHLCKCIAQTGIIASALQGSLNYAPLGDESGTSKALAKDLIDAPARVLTKVWLTTPFLERICLLAGVVYYEGALVGELKGMTYKLVPRRIILRKRAA